MFRMFRRNSIYQAGPNAWFDIRKVVAVYTDGSQLVVRFGSQGIARLTRFDLHDTAEATAQHMLAFKRSNG